MLKTTRRDERWEGSRENPVENLGAMEHFHGWKPKENPTGAAYKVCQGLGFPIPVLSHPHITKHWCWVWIFITKWAPLQFIDNHGRIGNSILYKQLQKYWEWSMVRKHCSRWDHCAWRNRGSRASPLPKKHTAAEYRKVMSTKLSFSCYSTFQCSPIHVPWPGRECWGIFQQRYLHPEKSISGKGFLFFPPFFVCLFFYLVLFLHRASAVQDFLPAPTASNWSQTIGDTPIF